LYGQHVQAIHGGQVNASRAIQLGAQVKARFVAAAAVRPAGWRQGLGHGIDLRCQGLIHPLRLGIAGDQLLLVEVVGG